MRTLPKPQPGTCTACKGPHVLSLLLRCVCWRAGETIPVHTRHTHTHVHTAHTYIAPICEWPRLVAHVTRARAHTHSQGTVDHLEASREAHTASRLHRSPSSPPATLATPTSSGGAGPQRSAATASTGGASSSAGMQSSAHIRGSQQSLSESGVRRSLQWDEQQQQHEQQQQQQQHTPAASSSCNTWASTPGQTPSQPALTACDATQHSKPTAARKCASSSPPCAQSADRLGNATSPYLAAPSSGVKPATAQSSPYLPTSSRAPQTHTPSVGVAAIIPAPAVVVASASEALMAKRTAILNAYAAHLRGRAVAAGATPPESPAAAAGTHQQCAG